MRTVREECKRRHGGEPCMKTYGADLVTVIATADCVDWCPILRRPADLLVVERKAAA
jgi:hypothetical protein